MASSQVKQKPVELPDTINEFFDSDEYPNDIAKLLGLGTNGKVSPFEALTLEDFWVNSELRKAFLEEIDQTAKAKIAAEYVRWFVDNAEKELQK